MKSYYISKSADVYGDVIIEKDVNIWHHAVLRGDNQKIHLKKGCNIQDGCVVHVEANHDVVVGEYVTVGHRAIIHGCHIGDYTMIGMGATILNGAVIGENCVVGANSLVTQGKVFPNNVLIMGSPAKVIRPLTEEEKAFNKKNALHYIELSKKYQKGEYKKHE